MRIKSTLFIIALTFIVLVPHILVIFAHQNIVLNRFQTDDAFYYFKTAQNIVEGQGISFDGIARTNGFHPLWMILMVPVFSLASLDLILPLRLVIALQVLLGLGAGLVLFQFIQTRFSRWTAFFTALLLTFTPIIYDVTFKGGTEAGLNAFFVVLFWWQLYRTTEELSQERMNTWRIAALGGLASLTLFSRLDNVYLVFLAGGWLILRFWRQNREESSSPISMIKMWLTSGIPYFTPVVLSLGLYLAINQLYFSSAMPVSGKIKRWWGTLKYSVYGTPPETIRDFFVEFFSPENSRGPWSIVIAPAVNLWNWYITLENSSKLLIGTIIFALFSLIVLLIYQNRKFVITTIRKWNLIPLLGACLVHILYYKAFGHVSQKDWYWITEMILVILIIGIVIGTISRSISKHPQGEKVVIAAVSAFAVALVTPYLKIPYKVIRYKPPTELHSYFHRAKWLEENTEPNSLIGMTGSGSSGYFVQDRTLVNLDGLISSQEYFVHLQNNDIDEYLESIDLDYVFGNAYILQRTNPYQWSFENHLEDFNYYVVDKYLESIELDYVLSNAYSYQRTNPNQWHSEQRLEDLKYFGADGIKISTLFKFLSD